MTKFCIDIQDLITYTTFSDDQLRGLGVARDRISIIPIDVHRRPYNSLALPCKCVITHLWMSLNQQCQGTEGNSLY